MEFFVGDLLYKVGPDERIYYRRPSWTDQDKWIRSCHGTVVQANARRNVQANKILKAYYEMMSKPRHAVDVF